MPHVITLALTCLAVVFALVWLRAELRRVDTLMERTGRRLAPRAARIRWTAFSLDPSSGLYPPGLE